MCGRYFLDLDFEQVLALYDFVEGLEKPEFRTGEIFPSQSVLVVQSSGFSAMRWGMKYDFMKRELINARSETVHEKRLFSEAFQKRRVILPASAYFEWEKEDSGKIKRRIGLEDSAAMSLAGIYNKLQIGGEWVDAVAILTMAAHESIRHIHDRMPLIVPKGLEEAWLKTDQPRLLMEEMEAMRKLQYLVE